MSGLFFEGPGRREAAIGQRSLKSPTLK